MTTDAPASRRGSCLGRLVKLSLVLLILLAVTIGLLPKIISSGPGTRFVERVASKQINGRVSIAKLDLSWGGPQEVSGLQLDDAAGATLARLEISLANGLIALARGEWKALDATIGGSADVELRQDGSTNFSTLLRKSPAEAAAPEPGRGTKKDEGPARVPAGLDARIVLSTFDLTLREQATGRHVKFRDLSGEALVGTERPIAIKLAGASDFEGRIGSLALESTVTNLIGRGGEISWAGAAIAASAKVGSVAVPFPQMLVEVKTLDASLRSTDLTGEILLELQSSAVLNGSTPSDAHLSLRTNGLFAKDGTLTFRPEALIASVRATNVPTALAAPFLAGQAIVLSRDVGPIVNAALVIPGGGGDLKVMIQSERLRIDGTGSIAASGAVAITTLDASTTLQPALLESLTGLASTAAIPLLATARRVVVPPATDDGTPLGAIAFESIVLSLPGAIELLRPATEAGSAATALGSAKDLSVSARSGGLASELHLEGGGQVEGGTLAIDQRVTNLVGADGALDPAGAAAIGTISLTGVAPQRLLNALQPEQAAIARELLTGPIEATLTTSGGAERTARLMLRSGGLQAQTDATLRNRTLAVTSATAVVPATSALLAALQKGSEKPVQTTPTALTAVFEPLTLDLDRMGTLLRDGPPIAAQLAMGDATFTDIPGTAAPLGVNQFAGKVTVTPGPALRVGFAGGARMTAAGAALSSLTVKLEASRDQEGVDAPAAITAEIAAPDIQVTSAEALLGRPVGSLTNLLGSRGSLDLKATPHVDGAVDLLVTPTFETAKGRLDARLADSLVTVREGRLEATLTPAQLNDLLTPKPAAGTASAGGPDAPATLTFLAPLGVTATLGESAVDLAALHGEPFDPTRVRATFDVKTTPLPMALSTGQQVGFEGLTARVSTPRIDQGINFEASAKGLASLSATGAVRNLVDSRSVLQPANASIDLRAEMRQLPTALLDRLQDLDGLLATTLGELIDGSLTLNALSSQAGTLAASLSAPNGRVNVPLASLREGLLVIEASKPISGELAITKPLRERLLRRINPILADIRQTQQPVKLAIPTFAYPLDGNLTRLDGDIQFTFGEVAFDAGSQLLGFLDLFNKRQSPVIPGLVEPLNVRIRQGQLAYQDFALRVGQDDQGWKHALVFSGDVDLTQKPPFARAIKSMYPAEGLSRSIKELQSVPLLGALSVGITFFGPLYDPAGNAQTLQSKVDVQLKPEDILKDRNIQKGIDSLLKKIK
jgi:hypothetical protein